MKSTKPITRLTRTVGLLALIFVLPAVVFVYASDPTPKPSRITKQQCKTTKKAVQAFIENDEVHPQNIQASLCDTLTITNRDDKTRIIAFGMHDNHISYDGVTERLMKKDGSFTVTLNKSGTYTFHDHNEEDVRAEITIQ